MTFDFGGYSLWKSNMAPPCTFLTTDLFLTPKPLAYMRKMQMKLRFKCNQSICRFFYLKWNVFFWWKVRWNSFVIPFIYAYVGSLRCGLCWFIFNIGCFLKSKLQYSAFFADFDIHYNVMKRELHFRSLTVNGPPNFVNFGLLDRSGHTCKTQKNWFTVTVTPTIENHGGPIRTPANQRWGQVPGRSQRLLLG